MSPAISVVFEIAKDILQVLEYPHRERFQVLVRDQDVAVALANLFYKLCEGGGVGQVEDGVRLIPMPVSAGNERLPKALR
jgi:hypothetical protein